MDDNSLLEKLKQHDESAFTVVFQRYSDKIYRLALSLLHDEQQSDGVVQNTFLALIEKIDTFEGRSNIGTWLYRVAYNEIMKRLRSVRPQVGLDEIEEEDFMPSCLIDWREVPDQIMSGQEAYAEMQRAVAALPQTLRSVFILRDIEELSTHATAEILGISEAAVKVRLHRARLTLREALAAYFEELSIDSSKS